MRKPSVTIGISAYNEQENIGVLLRALLREKPRRVRLVKIVVISDGSTDGTVAQVSKITSEKIQLVNQKTRKGLHRTQNRIARMAKSDILLLLDADVIPQRGLIDALCEPFIKSNNVGIAGAKTVPAEPRGWFEQIIVAGRLFKTSIYEQINNGNNAYLCHGRARALRKILYEQIVWPFDCPEDAYSYFFCLSQSMSFIYAPNAVVTFRAPSTLKEYREKNVRFVAGKNQLFKYFDQETIKNHLRIPASVVLRQLPQYLLQNPLRITIYLVLFLTVRILRGRSPIYQPLWEISESSKTILSD